MRRLAAAVVVLALAAPGAVWAQQNAGKPGVYDELNLFDEAFERIRQDAVDPVSDRKLIGAAIAGMLSGLDPHAAYLDDAALQAMKKPASGSERSDQGLVVTIDGGQLRVVSPRDGSPAVKAGVKPGDLIFAINKKPTFDLNLTEAEAKLRGPAGSKLELTLRHAGDSKPTAVTITRQPYKLETVSSRLEGSDIGYLRLAGFDDATRGALTSAMQDLQQKSGNHLIGIVLDLRNNPGGNFDDAVAAADAFISKGDIALIKGRKPEDTKHIAAAPGDIANGLPIVALVNGGTAHEAELVAGALQDDHRAVLLGTKTYGESAIESLIPLKTGGAIRLTTTRFLTPDGHEIQGKGLTPDIEVSPLKLERLAEIGIIHEADLPGALKNPDQTAKPANVPPGTTEAKSATGKTPSVATSELGSGSDEQLVEALDVLRGLALVTHRPS